MENKLQINCMKNKVEYIVIGNGIWQHFEQYTQHLGYMLLGIAIGKHFEQCNKFLER